MKRVSEVVLATDVLGADTKAELARWSGRRADDDDVTVDGMTALRYVQELLTEDKMVLAFDKETDLNAVAAFSKTVHPALLYCDKDPIEVLVGTNCFGEYLIPYFGDPEDDVSSQTSVMEEVACLHDGDRRVSFGSVRVLSFGATDAFVVCTPRGARDVGDHKESA